MADTANLTGKNAAMMAPARKSLIDEADTATGSATAAYQTAYANSIIKAMTPLLVAKDPNQRLNAAVVLGGVAAKVSHTNVADLFAPIAKTMLTDKYWPVAYWGLKIARYALADTVVNNNKNAVPGLTAAIIATVKANEKSGEIVEEAYLALVLDSLKSDPNYGSFLALTLPSMLDLVDWRTTLFAGGGVPVAPGAEAGPANTLPISGFTMLNAPANSPMKTRVLGSLGNFTVVELDAIVAASGTADPDLINGAENLGNAMNAFGQVLPDQPLAQAGTAISRLGNNPQPAAAGQCKAALKTALQSLGVSLAQSSP